MRNWQLRRRLVSERSSSTYPIISDYPEINEYGYFNFSVISVSTSNTVSSFIKSGDVGYPNMGSNHTVETFNVTINSQSIVMHMRTGTISVAFAGFPVRIKRCLGAESDPALTKFMVTKN